jgi:hypothetical protein
MAEKQIPWHFTPAVVIVAGRFALADAKIAE